MMTKKGTNRACFFLKNRQNFQKCVREKRCINAKTPCFHKDCIPKSTQTFDQRLITRQHAHDLMHMEFLYCNNFGTRCSC